MERRFFKKSSDGNSNSLPLFREVSKKDLNPKGFCAVCFVRWNATPDHQDLRKLQCGHCFHTNCLIGWLSEVHHKRHMCTLPYTCPDPSCLSNQRPGICGPQISFNAADLIVKRNNCKACFLTSRIDTALLSFMPPALDVVEPIKASNLDEDLVQLAYYHGLLPREDTLYLLRNYGDYLVRISEVDKTSSRYEMVLSTLHNPNGPAIEMEDPVPEEDVVHLIIYAINKKYYLDNRNMFNSVNELVQYFTDNTLTVKSLEIQLRRGIRLADWEFRIDAVLLGEKLRKAGNIELRKGFLVMDKKKIEVSVTTITPKSTEAKVTSTELLRQCRLLRNLRHPCIIIFYGTCLMSQPCCYLMEFCSEGPLDEFLRKRRGSLKLDEMLQMTMSAGWGVQFLHKNGVLHKDLAARNCLYNTQLVKIGGFGLARKAQTYEQKTERGMAVRWMAPETITAFKFSQKSDVYSFGVLTYEIFSQLEPYDGKPDSNAKALISRGKLNEFPAKTPKQLVGFVAEKLWQKDPDKRPDMESAMQWLTQYTGINLVISEASESPIVQQNFAAPVLHDVPHKSAREKALESPIKKVKPAEKVANPPRDYIRATPPRAATPRASTPRAATPRAKTPRPVGARDAGVRPSAEVARPELPKKPAEATPSPHSDYMNLRNAAFGIDPKKPKKHSLYLEPKWQSS